MPTQRIASLRFSYLLNLFMYIIWCHIGVTKTLGRPRPQAAARLVPLLHLSQPEICPLPGSLAEHRETVATVATVAMQCISAAINT